MSDMQQLIRVPKKIWCCNCSEASGPGWCKFCMVKITESTVVRGYLYKSFYFREIEVSNLDIIVDGMCYRGTAFSCYVCEGVDILAYTLEEMCKDIDTFCSYVASGRGWHNAV